MVLRRRGSPASTRLVQLALSLLMVLYMAFVGGAFAAGPVYEVKLLNFLVGSGLALVWLIVRLKRRRPLLATGLELPLVAFVLSQWVALMASPQPRLGLDWAASLVVWL